MTLGRLPERERTRLSSETSILQSLSHANIIEFYDVWDNPAKDEIVFTSEYVSSGTLKEFTRRAKDRVKLKVVKKCVRCCVLVCALRWREASTPNAFWQACFGVHS